MSETSATSRAAEPSPFVDVLCAVDGSPGGDVAVEQAAALAGRDGHITLLAVTSFRSAGSYRPPELLPRRVKEIVDGAAQIAADADVATSVEVDPAAPPADVILRWAAEHDLLAMGAPTTPWLGGLLGGGPVGHAVGELVTPLLIARDRAVASGPIVVASDGLDGSDRLVELAVELARTRGSAVHLLHALRRGPLAHERRRIAQQRQTLDRLAADATATIERAAARSLIVETVERLEAPLVVMGSRRLRGPRTIGSVSRHVAHHAGCSVLLIPPERLRAGRPQAQSRDAATGTPTSP
jgi:nucleotide-binding universal stress UspA family protein